MSVFCAMMMYSFFVSLADLSVLATLLLAPTAALASFVAVRYIKGFSTPTMAGFKKAGGGAKLLKRYKGARCGLLLLSVPRCLSLLCTYCAPMR